MYAEKLICEMCGEKVSADSVIIDNGEFICQPCFDELFVKCADCGWIMLREGAIKADNGKYYCQRHYDHRYTNCYDCGCEILREDAILVDGENYCVDHAPSDYADDWECKSFRAGQQTCRKVGSNRKFGVELETATCPNHTELADYTIFGCKNDDSIGGKEFISPVLSSDAGFAVIDEFCKLADQNDFTVDDDCGFHAHFDVRDLTVECLKKVAYAYHKTYEVWAAFVPKDRRVNHYCGPHRWGPGDFANIYSQDDWSTFADNHERYSWLNLNAYNCHGTFEIRLHDATLDAKKVCNWIAAHTRFIDTVQNMRYYEIDELFGSTVHSKFVGLSKVWKDDKLTDYFAGRAGKFGTDVTTREFAFAE